MARDDEFQLRPGAPRDRGKGQVGRGRRFVAEVATAARRAGLGVLELGPRRARATVGRGQVRPARSAAVRRVTVKARIVRHAGSRYRAASLGDHLRYLQRDGAGRDGRPADAFGQDASSDVDGFAERCRDDRHHFRFIISPEDAAELQDLRATTRDLLARAEGDLATRLDWIAVDHWNTDNPHVHVLVRGVADDGQDLVIARDYISQGLRDQAQALVALELGPRTEREVAASLDREVEAERLTSLDRTLRRLATDGRVDLRGDGARYGDDHRRLLGRAGTLERFGLARAAGAARWVLVDDLEPRLKALGDRGDVIRTLHRAMAGVELDPAQIAIQGDRLAAPVLGRVVERGLHDELTGQAYLIVDGIDGRLHHFRFGDLEATGDTRPGGIVEVLARGAGQGGGPVLVHRSDMPVERQVQAPGATWLDRRLVAADPAPLSGQGFGQVVSDGQERRRAHLQSLGLMDRKDGQWRPSGGLIAKLRSAELAVAGARLEGQSGLRHRPLADGELVSGVYRQRVDLTSGRFAMIDDGLGFQLAPWTRGLDAKLGLEVRGRAIAGGGIDWALGRQRGLER